MFANRMLLLGAAMGLLVGCGHDDRANAAPKAAATRTPTAAPTRAATSKPASGTAAQTTAKPATKPVAKSTSVAALKIPQAQLPPPGKCRIWKEGTTVSQQPQVRSCNGITPTAPAGSMVLYRSAKETNIVRVGYIDAKRAGMVTLVRVFDARTGKYLRDEKV